jgi:hypothetical protein
MPVRANAPARGVASMPWPPRPLASGDRVRARNDRADRDLPRILFQSARKRMTAYLLSLALIGLVTIVILERIVMSADIIRFIPRPDRRREPTDFPTIAFRSLVKPDNLVMDRADTAPCEHVPAESEASA